MKGYEWRSWRKTFQRIRESTEGEHFAIVFDTETTGLPGRDGLTESTVKIIQFSGMLIEFNEDGYEEVDRFDTYINPMEQVSEEIEKITGISNETLINAPLEQEIAPVIAEFMGKARVWIGYNIGFDVARIYYLCERNGIEFPLKGKPKTIDVLEMARDCITPESIETFKKNYNSALGKDEKDKKKTKKYRLENVAMMVLPDFTAKFHDSMEDVKATAEAFFALYPIEKALAFGDSEGGEKVNVEGIFFSARLKSPWKSREILIRASYEGKERETLEVVWNVSSQYWTCHSKKKADHLGGTKQGPDQFKELDLYDLEEKVIAFAMEKGYQGEYGKERYNPGKFNTPNMDSLAIEMEKAWQKSPSGKKFAEITQKERKEQNEAKRTAKYSEKIMEDEER